MTLPPTRTPRRGALLDLGAFAATVGWAFWHDWKTAPLVWGLWLSSLTVGYCLIVYSLGTNIDRAFLDLKVPRILRGPDGLPVVGSDVPLPPLGRLVLALFMLAFFTLHFVGFHAIHGAFLWWFFPLPPVASESDFAYLDHIPAILSNGWPLVLGSLVAVRGAFARAREAFNPVMPYLNIIRMHVLIFVFAFAHAAGLQQRWMMIVVLFFYYFPLGSLRTLLASSKAEGSSGPPPG